jgi:hypothetical protein
MLNKYWLLSVLFAVLWLSSCAPEKRIAINAECGIMMNNVFNKVGTLEDCKVQCRNQCAALDMGLSKPIFSHDSKTGCNSCECICR